MNAEIYAQFLKRQGHKVVRTESSYWHSPGMRVFQAFPEHRLIRPGRKEIDELLLGHRALAIRYSMPADPETKPVGYHVVCTDGAYCLDNLSSWARKNVRRGMKSCTVEHISLEKYTEEGWDLRLDTLARQHRRVNETQEDWRRKCKAVTGLDGFEIWAALVNGRLGATLLFFQMERWGYMVYQQCHRGCLREHVNNALSYSVTQEVMRRRNIRGIFYGMQSLDAPPSVDEFKFRMGYSAMPVRQTVDFHPYLSPLVNAITLKLVRTMMKVNPGSQLLSKGEGMMRLRLGEMHANVESAGMLPSLSTRDDGERMKPEMHDA